MASSAPVREICGLAFMAHIGSIAIAERAADTGGSSGAADRVVALDAQARGSWRRAA